MSAFAKVTILFAVAFVVGVGLCGLDAALLSGLRNPGEEFGPNTIVGGIGAWAILLSGVGLIVTILLWIVVSLAKSFSHKDSEPQKLFDESAEAKHDDQQ
jgi:hypothetical protein